ncbi:hypothetical protein M8J75_006732 [Diaphorina citri]|nr:hypothetical protein M8J75_006732 [Diaphorina citri]
MFIKTHKCGSSTVQNILLRYGIERHLEFALPEKIHLGHPKHFKPEMIPNDISSVKGDYNILAHHARYDPVEMKKLMSPDDTLYVTILREPSSMFESMYNFYNLGLIYQNISLEDILISPGQFSTYKSVLSHRYPYRLGLNQMSFDLGMEESMFENNEAVSDFITILSQDFDLVMIAEHMEVSLILLADLMQWPLEQVVYLNHMSRNKKRVFKLTEDNRMLLRDMNLADTLLYEYFLRVLQKKVFDYGVERMREQVTKLITLNYEFKNSCVKYEHYTNYGGTISYYPKEGANAKCLHAVMSEQQFSDNLRFLQYEKLRGTKLLEQLLAIDTNYFYNTEYPSY